MVKYYKYKSNYTVYIKRLEKNMLIFFRTVIILIFFIILYAENNNLSKIIKEYKKLNSLNCPNKKVVEYSFGGNRYTFKKLGFVPPQEKNICEFSSSTFMYINNQKKPILEIKENILGIRFFSNSQYTKEYMAIFTSSGTHGGRAYFVNLANYKFVKVFDYCLNKYLNYFQSDTSNNIFIYKVFDEKMQKLDLAAILYNYTACNDEEKREFLEKIKYRFDEKNEKFTVTKRELFN